MVELLVSVAAMVIVLGVMVQMARDVRGRNADMLTRRVLAQLDGAVSEHPDLLPLLAKLPQMIGENGSYDEADLQAGALENNRAFVKLWRTSAESSGLSDLPLSVFDEKTGTLRDPWGTPIVFMPAGARNIGIAPQSRFFFLSAGPDRMFTTVLDNLYSYEGPAAMAATEK